jgi:hypothetical protein
MRAAGAGLDAKVPTAVTAPDQKLKSTGPPWVSISTPTVAAVDAWLVPVVAVVPPAAVGPPAAWAAVVEAVAPAAAWDAGTGAPVPPVNVLPVPQRAAPRIMTMRAARLGAKANKERVARMA